MEDVGNGLVSRASAAFYRFLILQVYLVLTCGPTVVVWTLLAPAPTNLILFAAALLPVAPALSGALYGIRTWAQADDLRPAGPLWRGFVRNLKDTLKWWVLVLAIGAVLATNVLLADSVPGGDLLRPICLALALPLGVWSGHLLVISSYFSFRTRDALRVAAVEVFVRPKSSFGFLGLLIMAAAVVLLSSEAVLLLLAWVFAGLLRLNARPVEEDVKARFTEDET